MRLLVFQPQFSVLLLEVPLLIDLVDMNHQTLSR